MVGIVDHFGPKTPRSPMLIEHHPIHLNKGPILAFNNAILLGHIRRGKLMLECQRGTKGSKMSILELCTIVTLNRSHGIFGKLILQPKNQISSARKSLILRLHEEHPRTLRKVINFHKHIPLPSKRENLSWTNSVHVKQLTELQGHHLGDPGMGNNNHSPMITRVTNKIILKFWIGPSLVEVK